MTTKKITDIHELHSFVQSTLKAPKNQWNSFGKYKYRNAEDINDALKPLLAKHGATIRTPTEMVQVGDNVYVKATAILQLGEQSIECTGWARESVTKKGMDDSQITGTAQSYAVKYALGFLFAIDDTKDADATNDHGKAEKVTYPDKDFKSNWATWEGLIAEGKVTPQALIERINERFTLTDKQKELLRGLEVQNEAA